MKLHIREVSWKSMIALSFVAGSVVILLQMTPLLLVRFGIGAQDVRLLGFNIDALVGTTLLIYFIVILITFVVAGLLVAFIFNLSGGIGFEKDDAQLKKIEEQLEKMNGILSEIQPKLMLQEEAPSSDLPGNTDDILNTLKSLRETSQISQD